MSLWKPHQPRGATQREVNNGQNFKWRPEPIEFVQWKGREMTRGKFPVFWERHIPPKKETEKKKPSGPNWTSGSSSIYSWPFVTRGKQHVHTESGKNKTNKQFKTNVLRHQKIHTNYLGPLKLSIWIKVWACKPYTHIYSIHTYMYTYVCMHLSTLFFLTLSLLLFFNCPSVWF